MFLIIILGCLCLSENIFTNVHSEVHYYDFILTDKNFTRMCNTKSMPVINESFPGPVIRARKGDTVYVNVYNQGIYGVTLHWHGVKQPRNPWFDGPEYITQCPIEAGSNFTYQINFSIEEGTLWWHAHNDWTRATVHGAIVVLPAVDTSPPFLMPDEEEIIVLAVWYDGNLMELVDYALESGSDFPDSNGYTINGEPGDFCSCSKNTTYRWMVDAGKTYLLRVINAVLNEEMFFAIADHNLTIVGMDGAYTKPFSTSYIVISPGQTMDFLLTTDQSPGQYYMAARQFSSDDPEVTAFDHSNVTAILQYKGNYSSSSPTFPTAIPSFLDIKAALGFTNQLRSLANEDFPINVPKNVTTRMYITGSLNEILCPNSSCAGIDGNKISTSLNNISWVSPKTDVLQAYYKNISGFYTTDFPDFPPSFFNFTGDDLPDDVIVTGQGTKLKVLEYDEQVEIVFQGTNTLKGSMNHPMHLHGYSFFVVGYGYGNFDNETDPNGYNLVDPPQVNTFSIPKRGWVAIRFIANNPGVWFWHCHYEKHLSWGMDTVFIVKNGDTPNTSMSDPPAYMPPCSSSSSNFVKEISNSYEKTNNFIMMQLM